MKIRKGFVTNSSSSSFVCVVCGAVESGMDVSLSEVGYKECGNGHILCGGHAPEDSSIEDKSDEEILAIARSMTSWDVKYDVEQYDKATTDLEREDRLDNLKETMENTILPEDCPVCSFNEFSADDLPAIICHVTGKSRKEILEGLKKEFGTYDDMQKKLT